MKDQIIKVAKDLESDKITEERAMSLLVGLFEGKNFLSHLTVQKVSAMVAKSSKEAWVASQGNENGWKEWWTKENKLFINRVTSLPMREYLAFYGKMYYPDGGMDDFVGDYDTLEEAIHAIEEKHNQHFDSSDWEDNWANIWSSTNRTEVWSK